jgi:GTP-binding protein EngB required for normal cell division
MVGIYTLMGKKWGFSPIDLTLVDYAGEWVHDLPSKIDPANFPEVIARLSGNLKVDPKTLSENIGFIKFITSIKENSREIVPTIIEDVVLAFIYKRMTSSGKIILLIDGDMVAKNDGPSRDELTRLFGYYVRIMDYLGQEKQYALIVTKTDKIVPIDAVSENSPQAKEIEQEIFDRLHTITTFQAIENKAGSIPIFFFTVSVNSMSSNEEQAVISQIFPWRFGEVAKFEF